MPRTERRRVIPFDKMHMSFLVSAACELVQHLRAGLGKLESETNATWRRVVEPLEVLHDSYERMTSVFELLAAANQTSEMEAAAGQGKEQAHGFSRRLHQSTALCALLMRIRQPLTAWMEHSFAQLRALHHRLAKMRKGGVRLASCPAKMADFNRLSNEEASLKRQYAGNVAQGTAAFHLTLRNGVHLQGVPRSALAAMAAAAQARNLTYGRGWTWATAPASTQSPIDGTNNCDICNLVHCFSYDYLASYYSYLWSEMRAFEATGNFTKMGSHSDTIVRALGKRTAEELRLDGIGSNAEGHYEKFRRRPVSTKQFVAHVSKHV